MASESSGKKRRPTDPAHDESGSVSSSKRAKTSETDSPSSGKASEWKGKELQLGMYSLECVASVGNRLYVSSVLVRNYQWARVLYYDHMGAFKTLEFNMEDAESLALLVMGMANCDSEGFGYDPLYQPPSAKESMPSSVKHWKVDFPEKMALDEFDAPLAGGATFKITNGAIYVQLCLVGRGTVVFPVDYISAGQKTGSSSNLTSPSPSSQGASHVPMASSMTSELPSVASSPRPSAPHAILATSPQPASIGMPLPLPLPPSSGRSQSSDPSHKDASQETSEDTSRQPNASSDSPAGPSVYDFTSSKPDSLVMKVSWSLKSRPVESFIIRHIRKGNPRWLKHVPRLHCSMTLDHHDIKACLFGRPLPRIALEHMAIVAEGGNPCPQRWQQVQIFDRLMPISQVASLTDFKTIFVQVIQGEIRTNAYACGLP